MPTKSVNAILRKHGVKLSVKKQSVKLPKKRNPINLGGRQGEDLVENDLIRSGVSFSKQPTVEVSSHFFEEKRKRFDFVINNHNEKIYVEAKYQHVEGSVKDKIAGFIWSLTFTDYNVVIVLNGKAFKDKYIQVMVNRIENDENLNKRIKIIKGSEFHNYLLNLNS